jgi:hypothetical protein
MRPPHRPSPPSSPPPPYLGPGGLTYHQRGVGELKRRWERQAQQSRCFIATAACGSGQAVDVVRLQQFRDRVLRRTALGRTCIMVYERLSPPLAHRIAHSARARGMVRRVIVQPAAWVATRLCHSFANGNWGGRRGD